MRGRDPRIHLKTADSVKMDTPVKPGYDAWEKP